jgi:hypothetical protein
LHKIERGRWKEERRDFSSTEPYKVEMMLEDAKCPNDKK